MDNLRAELSNIKSFLGVYNRITELCFKACVENLSTRRITPEEDRCVDNCYKKFSSANQRLLVIYMEQQQEINKRRAADLAEQEQLALQKAREEALKQQQEQQKQNPPSQEPQVITNPVQTLTVEETKS
ncbi:mitochondrial import inner membrane translocase subunit Tim10B [Culicoides brevitarsis]|uniref:mitochondrial import inner membrane translocase subunit Tim10B n=1 Tax=Culicoides brevitarsis TaxID=469753 RepID=UPI00307B5F6D